MLRNILLTAAAALFPVATGVDTQLVVYPDTHHSGWSEEFAKDYLRRVRKWFDKYLK